MDDQHWVSFNAKIFLILLASIFDSKHGQYNPTWKEVQTLIVVGKALKNVPKVSLNIPSQVDIQIFPLESSPMLHLIQLWLHKHQLTSLNLGAREGWHLMSNI